MDFNEWKRIKCSDGDVNTPHPINGTAIYVSCQQQGQSLLFHAAVQNVSPGGAANAGGVFLVFASVCGSEFHNI
jgi:hypothetical protein